MGHGGWGVCRGVIGGLVDLVGGHVGEKWGALKKKVSRGDLCRGVVCLRVVNIKGGGRGGGVVVGGMWCSGLCGGC